ncbi:hypothetical protein ABT336_23890 [Micromonospora sp. NPDC000207]|uniref:SCO6745 family protein n=1 Tax=Micromonospora sp. NPDC000207 TaxID=3154246 RepID=UPI003322BD3B
MNDGFQRGSGAEAARRSRTPDRSTPVSLTPERVAAAVRPEVMAFGDAFARWPGTLRRARQLGISSWTFHVAGWAGALGDVSAATVSSALGFLAPEAVAEGWDGVSRLVRPTEVAAASLAECCRWGDEQLAALPGVDRLALLLDRAVEAADATGMPLFAAWRSMPRPAGAVGARAAVGLRLLREHVHGASLIAIRASGMTPLEAVLTTTDGEATAITCGWPPPYPPVGALVRRRFWADAATDRLVSAAFGVLTPAEGGELVELVGAARRQVTGTGTSTGWGAV